MVLAYSNWGDTTAMHTAQCFTSYSPQFQLEQAQKGAIEKSSIWSASARMQSNGFWFSLLQKITQVWTTVVLHSVSSLLPPCPKTRSDWAHRFLQKERGEWSPGLPQHMSKAHVPIWSDWGRGIYGMTPCKTSGNNQPPTRLHSFREESQRAKGRDIW